MSWGLKRNSDMYIYIYIRRFKPSYMSYNDNDLVRFLLGVDGLHMARDDCKETHQHPVSWSWSLLLVVTVSSDAKFRQPWFQKSPRWPVGLVRPTQGHIGHLHQPNNCRLDSFWKTQAAGLRKLRHRRSSGGNVFFFNLSRWTADFLDWLNRRFLKGSKP